MSTSLSGFLGRGSPSGFLVDPPELKRTLKRIDGIGIGLLVVGLIALQIVLLRGEREDWFDSSLITVMAMVAIVSLTSLAYWEWRVDEPVINSSLVHSSPFQRRVTLVFLFGIPFFAGPFLLPLFLQGLRGYPALGSGLTLLPQALTIVLLAPLVGVSTTAWTAVYWWAAGLS